MGRCSADDRTFATWYAVVEARLTTLGTTVFYMVSDRAKALIQLAEQGLECLSMPDFFHVVHEIVKSYSLALGQRWRYAQQELTKPRRPWHASRDGPKRSTRRERPKRSLKRDKQR